jgi:isopenicillin-N epimerase
VTAAPTADVNPLWGDDWPSIRELWPLERTVAHLNHGSFGAVPTIVLDEQRSWRERMESNPVRFFARELGPALGQAREELAQLVGAQPETLAFVPNVTTGIATVLAAVPLSSDDEVVITDHAYGAVRIATNRRCADTGARLVEVPVPLTGAEDETVQAVLDATTARTRLVVLEQVTSPTARQLPLDRLIPALHDRDIPVFVDGAHAPGMVDVDVERLGADFWTGNLHKWACAPRGTALLHVAARWRQRVRPLVASWHDALGFPDAFATVGTTDLTAWLSAPRSIRLLAELGWERLRRHNARLVEEGQRLVGQELGLDSAELVGDPQLSMRIVPLPRQVARDYESAAALQARLAEEGGVEVAVTTWRGRGFVRLSAHVYNAPGEYERLAEALPAMV